MPNNGAPEAWLYQAIEAGGCSAWPTTPPDKLNPPFAVFSRDSTERDFDLEEGSTGAVFGEFTVEIFHNGYLAAKALADAIRASVNNFTGTAHGATIDRVQLTDERDGIPVRFDGRSDPTYVIEQTYQIHWNE